MKRPLCCGVGFYIIGVIGGQWISDWKSIVLFCALFIGLMYLIFIGFRIKWAWVFGLFGIVGGILSFWTLKPIDIGLDQQVQSRPEATAYGYVQNIGTTQTGRTKITLRTEVIEIGDTRYKKPIQIQIILEEGQAPLYKQYITIKGPILAFEPSRNPGGFDEKRYMKTRKIEYKMFGRMIGTGAVNYSPAVPIYLLRKKLENTYNHVFPAEEASIMKAMLLGNKEELDGDIKGLYQKAGISHILAISGLHVAILGLLIQKATKFLRLPKKLGAGITLGSLILYCILTGAYISTIRAVWMMGVVLIGIILQRDPDIFTSIALSALGLLLYEPLYLWDIGFQLSYGAVIGMLITAPMLQRLLFCIPPKIRILVAGSSAAALSTYPIVAYHFYTIPVFGVLINVIILPFISLIVGFGLLVGVMGFISQTAASFSGGIVYVLLNLYEAICRIVETMPFHQVLIGRPALWTILLYYGTLSMVAFYLYVPKERRKYHEIFLLAGILGWGGLFVYEKLLPQPLNITFLDVGQGDAVVIHTPYKQHILIDGGGNIHREVGEDNTGKRIIIPYLQYKGVSRLDSVFLTHPDGDHILGLIEILDYIPVGQIVVPDVDMSNHLLYQVFEEKARYYNIPIYRVLQGDEMYLSKDLQLSCIYPLEAYRDFIPPKEKWNDISLVLQLSYQDTHFLFTGDIEQAQEEEICVYHKSMESVALKVPHHGSKTSSTEEFIKHTHPSAAIVSCGVQNSYGHPHREVVQRYESLQIPVYSTARHGAITILTYGKDATIQTMLH